VATIDVPVGSQLRSRPSPAGQGRRRPAVAVALLSLVAALVAGVVAPWWWSTTVAGAAGAVATRASADPSGLTAPLALVSQSSWVEPGQTFDLELRPAAGSPPTSQLGVSVSVYPCLSSVSAFDQSVATPPAGTAISATDSPLPVAGLPVAAGGGFDLDLPVVDGEDGSASAPFTIDLGGGGGQCQSVDGVYPVRVTLVDTSGGRTIGGLTTHLIYTDATASTERLQLALVLPLRATVRPAADPTTHQLLLRPSAALAAPAAGALDAVADTVDQMVHQDGVALTVDASPQTVQNLAGSTGGRATLSSLGTLAASPALHQLVWSTYVPVDAPGLVADGLGGELAAQVSRGTQLLSAEVAHVPVPTGQLGPWISGDGLDPSTAATLGTDGYTEVVVPTASTAGAPAVGSTTRPFQLVTARGSTLTALASNTDLASRFTGTPGNPVLAAHQLVAELAQIYYEEPNDPTARGVVVAAPSSWSDNPTFVEALLGALNGNPFIQSVTLDQLFSRLTTDTGCRPQCRLTGGAGASGLPVGAIRSQRGRIEQFTAATTGPVARNVSTELGDLVLSAESEDLRAGQQSAVLHSAGAALDAQLSQLVVSGDRTITLTSQRGRVPVTIVSSAPYPVQGDLTLTSDKLLFADGTTSWTQAATVLGTHTNVIYVNVQTRTSGQFKVEISLHSPTGGLELSAGEVSVRSTATSVVGVILSVGALVVLAVWWFRTSRRRRALRRQDDGEPALPGTGTP
jgi:hypothetical protein